MPNNSIACLFVCAPCTREMLSSERCSTKQCSNYCWLAQVEICWVKTRGLACISSNLRIPQVYVCTFEFVFIVVYAFNSVQSKVIERNSS